MESATSTASATASARTALASSHTSSSTNSSSLVSSTGSMTSTATTSDASSTASSTDTSLLSPSSLASLAESFPTYLAIGGAILGLVIVVCLVSWLFNKKRRQSRFKSRFGNDEDQEVEKNWKESRLMWGEVKKGERIWDPETGMGIVVGDEDLEASRRKKHRITLEDARVTGEEGHEPQGSVYEACPPLPPVTSRPTMRLLSTPSSPSSEIDISEARGHFPTSIEVQSIHSYVYNTPEPSPSASPVLGPVTEREEEEGLIKHRR
ncbi:hypothetical protein L202_05966 [Cryptococcus amylolentus CBS 6039]|uniref:Uncharacterized protein n=1 Tax=Cryptococcus amylolentus CBS 6039 TaxID=1295533 RepID=A0A1E3HJU9_9TREE|nr:hypothetical protein L202_05966 [Cryptococcus amylolentus CBS 6039]ODN76006.1 hypothetical protein L202_05966 [Cryptococcus amylolentus CBS 6039]